MIKIENGWIIGKLYDIEVEKKEIFRPNKKPYYRVSNSNICVLHTTESSTINGAFSTLKHNFSAPHFIVGENKIYQTRPLETQGAALKSHFTFMANTFAEIQIEIVEFTAKIYQHPKNNSLIITHKLRDEIWLPKSSSLEPLKRVLAFCHLELGIPLTIPNNFPDDISDMKGEIIARESNSRRRWAKLGNYPKVPGLWNHGEVPFNNHVDCFKMSRTLLIKEVNNFIKSLVQ